MTTISIALATYNGERFLREQLESLAKQSRLPDELVVADDGSTDRTLQIIGDFAASAPFKTIVLPKEEHLGYRANFMRCARHCTGDLIAFCDQDDVWDTEKLDVVERLIEPSACLLQHGFRAIDADGRLLPGSLADVLISDHEKWAPVLGLLQVFRRSLLNYWPLWSLSVDQNRPEERMAHDQWVYFLAITIGKTQVLQRPLLSYRQHGNNACGLSKHTISASDLSIASLLRNAASGNFDGLRRKRSLIAASLQNLLAAGRSRSEIIERLIKCEDLASAQSELRAEQKFYAKTNFYNHRRLTSYRSTTRVSTCVALLRAQPSYLHMGLRGLKDLALDTALSF